MKRWKDISIRNKILFSYSAIFLLFILLGINEFYGIKQIRAKIREIDARNFAGINLINSIEKEFLIINYRQHRAEYLGNENALKGAKKELEISFDKVFRFIMEYEHLPNKLNEILTVKVLLQEYRNTVFKEINSLASAEADSTKNKKNLLSGRLLIGLKDLRDNNIKNFYLGFNHIDRLLINSRANYFLLMSVLIGILVFLKYIFIKTIVKPIENLMAGMRKLSGGDSRYKIGIQSNDEIGSLHNGFIDMAAQLKQLYSILQKERDDFENRVRARAKALEELQSQFLQAEKMAGIGQLASGVAHEINNPLTGVLNNVQLIKMMIAEKKDFSFEEFRELLDAVEESALRCKKITESLLGFSHASMGEFKAISLNAVIEKVCGLIDNEIKLQNILLIRELQPDIPDIKGEFQLLQQVMANLISNAKWAIEKKFGKTGGIISIKSEHILNNAFVNVYVTDNGVGIADEKIKKIFDPFFTTKQVDEGTGLGLSVAYSIIKKHKGSISVESKINEGATFKVSLPVFLMESIK